MRNSIINDSKDADLQNGGDEADDEHDAPPGHGGATQGDGLGRVVLVGQAHQVCHQDPHTDERLCTAMRGF